MTLCLKRLERADDNTYLLDTLAVRASRARGGIRVDAGHGVRVRGHEKVTCRSFIHPVDQTNAKLAPENGRCRVSVRLGDEEDDRERLSIIPCSMPQQRRPSPLRSNEQ